MQSLVVRRLTAGKKFCYDVKVLDQLGETNEKLFENCKMYVFFRKTPVVRVFSCIGGFISA
jgi:hypothetical protein